MMYEEVSVLTSLSFARSIIIAVKSRTEMSLTAKLSSEFNTVHGDIIEKM